MIKLVFSGPCKDCPYSDLEIDHLDIGSYGSCTFRKRDWTVKCIHEDACDRMEQIVKEENDI